MSKTNKNRTTVNTFTLLAMTGALLCEACPCQEECDQLHGTSETGDGATPKECLQMWIEANE